MAMLVWLSELDTGIDEIDRQHRRILDYINTLHTINVSHDREELGEVIGEMVDYTLSHFVFEEALMENAGYLFAGPHKKVHELFTRRVAEYKTRFEAGEDVATELHGMLSRWLFNHIRNEDHGYIDSAKAYMRMAQRSDAAAQFRRMEAAHEQRRREKKRGWFSRIFGE